MVWDEQNSGGGNSLTVWLGVRVAEGLDRAKAGANIFCQMGVEFYGGIFCAGGGGQGEESLTFFRCSHSQRAMNIY